MKYENEIKQVLANVTEQSLDMFEIDEETALIGGDLGISSMDYVELLVSMEDEFDVVFDFSTQIETIGDLIDFLDEKKE